MGVRDPLGVRPLILGRIGNEGTGGWVLASETCALDIVGADFVRDVEPGEIVVINDQGVHSIKPFGRARERFCVFEYIYFARPDSVMEGTPVYEARKRIGAELARESGVPADVDRAGARFRRARGDGLRGGERHPVRAWHHPQPLCRPHLHRADRPHPPSRREAEALRQPAGAGGQAGRSWWTTSSCAARPAARSSRWCAQAGARGSAHAHLLAADHAFLLLRHRHAGARQAAGGAALRWRRWRSRSARTAWRSSRSTGCIARWASRSATRREPHYCDACFTGDYPIALPDQARQLRAAAEPAGREPLMPPLLTARVALVTGASRGIGAAAAVELARLGAHVVITARTQGGLEETDDAIRAVGGTRDAAAARSCGRRAGRRDRAEPVPALRPARRAGARRRRARAADARSPHILPNDWADVVAVNLTAAWRLIRTCDPLLRRRRGGPRGVRDRARARDPKAYWGAYGATKAGDGASGADLGGRGEDHAAAGEPVRPGRRSEHGCRARRCRARIRLPAEAAEVAPQLAALCLPEETRHAEVAIFDAAQRSWLASTSCLPSPDVLIPIPGTPDHRSHRSGQYRCRNRRVLAGRGPP